MWLDGPKGLWVWHQAALCYHCDKKEWWILQKCSQENKFIFKADLNKEKVHKLYVYHAWQWTEGWHYDQGIPLGLAPKHLSVHRHLRRKEHTLFNILHRCFSKSRTSLAKLVVFVSYYLLMTCKISVCTSWKLLCSTTNLLFYKLIYICTCYLILLENISDTSLSVIFP